MEFNHISVLLNECIDALNIKPTGVYIDGTAGGAGHSLEITKHLDGGVLIAIDKDPDAVKIATERLSSYDKAIVVENDFKNIDYVSKTLGYNGVDGILVDLGVSSHQLDTGERGFSYNFDAKLDMRMSQSGLSAFDVVNTYSVGQLSKVISNYGEEKFAWKIAQVIVKAREKAPIQSTFELVELIKQGIPAAARREGGHPAKRTFQAIRIEVNGELESLANFLDTAFDLLNVGGRLAVITFHSLEDRIVKQKFGEYCLGCTCPPNFPICICGKTPRGKLVSKKPIIATEQEIIINKRSRTAKLRVIERQE